MINLEPHPSVNRGTKDMKKNLTKEQELGQDIVMYAARQFGIVNQQHTMVTLSEHICSSTTWVDSYNEMERAIKFLKQVGAKDEQITHKYDKDTDHFSVTFDCNMF